MARLLAVLLLSSLTSAVVAQPETVVEVRGRPIPEITRLSAPIEFDGRVDDRAWDDIRAVPLVRHWPSFDDALSERSEIRLAYDDEFLYVAARCFDTGRISETSYKRDDWSDQDDQIAVVIDSYNDHESALVFVMYPTGVRVDASVSNDARTGDDINVDWNTFWDAEVSRDDQGWYGEMRIPWSSLRFQPSDAGDVTMGIITYRYIARLNEMQVYPSVAPDWGYWSFVKPSKGDRRSFGGLQATRPLYVTPYVIGGVGQASRLNASETRYIRHDDPTFDAGFDLKYGLTSNLTLDLTVNTDFAQVEADNQQVNLTRFSLFFPEKRQFFLERTSNFDFGFGDVDRVFYSRRIGINDGTQVQLLGGGRLVGRAGPWDVGVLTMQSARAGTISSENFGVLRMKRQVANPNSHIGGIATSRVGLDGTYNAVYGLDGVLNVTGDEYVRLNWAQSFESTTETAVAGLANARFRLLWQRAREIGMFYEAGLSRAGAQYDPGIGFQRRQDFTETLGKAGYGWRPASSVISKQVVALESSLFFRNADQQLETAEADATYEVAFVSGATASAGVTTYYEDLLDGFELSDDAEIIPGRYRYLDGSLSLTTPPGRAIRGSLALQAGSFFDGNRTSAMASPAWSISPKLELTATYAYDRIRFPDRGQSFDAHVIRARADVMLNTKLAISSFVQYNSAGDAVIANARLRINPREGNDFYLVYNEGFNTDRYASMPVLPLSTTRTVIAKYTYTFLW